MESSWEPLLTSTFIIKYKVREFCNLMTDSPSDSNNTPLGPPAPLEPPATRRRTESSTGSVTEPEVERQVTGTGSEGSAPAPVPRPARGDGVAWRWRGVAAGASFSFDA